MSLLNDFQNIFQHKYNLFESDNKTWDSLTQSQKNAILNTPKSSFDYIYKQYLHNLKTDPPPELIHRITFSPDLCFRYATFMSAENKDVPEEVLKGIAKDSYYANAYLNILKDKPHPEIIVNALDETDTLQYIKNNFTPTDNIPSHLLNKLNNLSIHLALQFYKSNNIPPIVKHNILKSPNRTLMYVEFLLKNNLPVEEVYYQNISKDDEMTYLCVKDVLKPLNKPIPEYFIDTLIKSVSPNIELFGYAISNEIPPEHTFNDIDIEDVHKFLLDSKIDDSKLSHIPKIKEYWIRPQKQAEEYNRIYHGIVWHSTDKTKLQEMQLQNNYQDEKELCVASIFSNRVFDSAQITLIGKTQLRMLFDFDVYSNLYGNMRVPEKKDDNITEKEEVINKINKLKKLQVQDNDEYHDEGFTMPSDTTWFAWTGPEFYKKYMRRYGYFYIPFETFDSLMQEEQVAEKLYRLYKKLHNDQDLSPEEKEEEQLISESRKPIMNIRKFIRTILFENLDEPLSFDDDNIEDTVWTNADQETYDRATQDKDLMSIDTFRQTYQNDPKGYRLNFLAQLKKAIENKPTVIPINIQEIPKGVKELTQFIKIYPDGTIVIRAPDQVEGKFDPRRKELTRPNSLYGKFKNFLNTGVLGDLVDSAGSRKDIITKVATKIEAMINGDHPSRRFEQLDRKGIIDDYINDYAKKHYFDIFDLTSLKPKIKEKVMSLRK